MVRLAGLEPATGKTPADFKPAAYANFATAAPNGHAAQKAYHGPAKLLEPNPARSHPYLRGCSGLESRLAIFARRRIKIRKRGATMEKSYRFWFLVLVMAIGVPNLRREQYARAQTVGAAVAQAKPAEIQVPGALIPTRILVQGPAETVTELQTICLFASAPENTLHGSLLEINEKLKGLLEQIRKPTLFRGELGETIVVAAPAGSLGAKRLLIIGLGDSRAFAPQDMDFVGAIVYRESTRMGIAHPYFAPTVLDDGVTKFTTGEIAENFVAGFLRAARTEKILRGADASGSPVVQDLTFLAGPSHAADTQQGIERAFAASSQSAKSSMRKIYEEDQKNRSAVDADARRRASTTMRR